MAYFAGPRLPVEPLGVALFAYGQRCIEMHFDELAGPQQVADHGAVAGEGGDEAGNDDQAGIDEDLAQFADAPDVLDTVGVAEAEVFVEPVANVVAVQQVAAVALGEEALFEGAGQGGFAGSAAVGEPDNERALGIGPAANASRIISTLAVKPGE